MASTIDHLTVALVRDTFAGDAGEARLSARLAEAREAGAQLALLPELPLDPWCPATDEAREADAEPPEGRRHQVLSAAAAGAGLAVVGGAIVRDPATGGRHNTVLVFDRQGALQARYRKVHVPWEEGFWERAHYDAGEAPPEPFQLLGVPLGLQLCSDLQRPQGCLLLGAAGAEVVLAPRATLDWTWERWLTVMRASATTAAVYLLSANRPGPEAGVRIGGPNVAIDPHGEVLFESEAAVSVVTVHRSVVADARAAYPGYLDVNADLYARGWRSIAEEQR